ncbi:MAG: 1-deoxy-D-xylulose-5-phosphate reductoisomerase [Oscillospiraceae bacterium]|nr:1-deoxy-D-xylulose-5-phosphate reductoisomerase [Oscillospiraceae bacterium]
MKKTITILGSTGSIGRQTLEVAEHLGLKINALTANSSIDLLEEQIHKFNPKLVAVYDENAAAELRKRIQGNKTQVLAGMDGQITAANDSGADIIVTAIAGQAGLEPTLAAVKTGKRIALANKEPLVCAGETVMQAARKHGAEIIPVDSEHSAIFQCLAGTSSLQSQPNQNRTTQNQPNQTAHPKIKKIILTASGGPFCGKTIEELEKITPEEALKHPNWNMGSKITIDSATLMNKGLELIEAMHLFNINPDKIEVLIHPQSIIHSMVEFEDGSVIAQLSNPDMRQPIQYALTYPDRKPSLTKPLNLTEIGTLTFEKPDTTTFPCLNLAYTAAKKGQNACAILNSANEKAVSDFLCGIITFNDIPKEIEKALKGKR